MNRSRSVPELRVIEAEPIAPDIIEKIEEALELARSGKLSSIAVAAVYRDGSTATVYSNAPSIGLQIAAVTRLQHRLLRIGEE